MKEKTKNIVFLIMLGLASLVFILVCCNGCAKVSVDIPIVMPDNSI